MKTAIATTLATATLAANPVFPVAWNADSASKLILWQGGTKTATGACCSTTAPQCKVQAQAQSGTAYTDGPNNRRLPASSSSRSFWCTIKFISKSS